MKLPVLQNSDAISDKRTPSDLQNELTAMSVPPEAASQPEFPRRRDTLRKGASLAIGSALLAGSAGLALGDEGAKAAPAQAAKPPSTKGTIDGSPIAKKAPKIMILRGGGGIGPSEEFDVAEVEAFLNWKFAKEKLDIETNYKLDHDGIAITLDGYDPQRNIGYEYFYGSDWDEFPDETRQALGRWMTEKKAAILLIDMEATPDASTLSKHVAKFFKSIKKNRPALGVLPPSPPPEPAKTEKTPPTTKKPAPQNPPMTPVVKPVG